MTGEFVMDWEKWFFILEHVYYFGKVINEKLINVSFPIAFSIYIKSMFTAFSF